MQSASEAQAGRLGGCVSGHSGAARGGGETLGRCALWAAKRGLERETAPSAPPSQRIVHFCKTFPCTLTNIGGTLETRFVCCVMPDANDAVVAPHEAQCPISTAICVQIGGCSLNQLAQALSDEFSVGWECEVERYPARVIDRQIVVRDGPGLGPDVNRAEVEMHRYQMSNLLPRFAPG